MLFPIVWHCNDIHCATCVTPLIILCMCHLHAPPSVTIILHLIASSSLFASTLTLSKFDTPQQEVRLDMGKGTALAHSISVGELDPSSSSSPTHHSQKHHQIATRGAGMESSGLRNRSSAAAHHQQQHRPSMVFSSSGGGGGGNGGEGPSSPHPVQSAATTTGGMNIQIPIPKNLNELFGVSPSDIDKYSRVVFPVCFVCFNLMYWMIYLHISKTLDPNAFDDESVVS